MVHDAKYASAQGERPRIQLPSSAMSHYEAEKFPTIYIYKIKNATPVVERGRLHSVNIFLGVHKLQGDAEHHDKHDRKERRQSHNPKPLCSSSCVSICTSVPVKQVKCNTLVPVKQVLHFTCFTGTRVQILIRRKAMRSSKNCWYCSLRGLLVPKYKN